MERILNILSLCLQAKAKGHDVFFYYHAHINQVEVKVYKGGWKPADFDEIGKVKKTYESANMDFYADDRTGSHAIDEVEEYLKELV